MVFVGGQISERKKKKKNSWNGEDLGCKRADQTGAERKKAMMLVSDQLGMPPSISSSSDWASDQVWLRWNLFLTIVYPGTTAKTGWGRLGLSLFKLPVLNGIRLSVCLSVCLSIRQSSEEGADFCFAFKERVLKVKPLDLWWDCKKAKQIKLK